MIKEKKSRFKRTKEQQILEFIGPKIDWFLFLESLTQFNYPPLRKWSVNILSKPSWWMNSNHQGIMSSAIEYWSTRLCKNIVRLQYFSSPFYLFAIIDSFIMWTLQLHDVNIAPWWWSEIGEKLPCCNCNCTKVREKLVRKSYEASMGPLTLRQWNG